MIVAYMGALPDTSGVPSYDKGENKDVYKLSK